MDPTPFLEPRIPPRVIFDRLGWSSRSPNDILPKPTDGPAPTSVSEQTTETLTAETSPRFWIPQPDGQWEPITWGQYASEIQHLTEFLVFRNLSNGERACIFAPNRVEWATVAMAIQAAGGVMVPIYGSSTAEQAAYVASHSDAGVVFVDTPPLIRRILSSWKQLDNVHTIVVLNSLLDVVQIAQDTDNPIGNPPALSWIRERFVSFDEAISHGKRLFCNDPTRFYQRLYSISLDQVGLMLYTSGTSGPPKGVPLTHANVAANGRDWLLCNAPLLEEKYIDLLWLPMSHIFGFGALAIGNALGFTTYLTDPGNALTLMPEVRPHVFMSVPAYWEKLATAAAQHAHPSETLAMLTGGRLRFCLSGGAGLKKDVKEFFHNAGLLIVEGYGLTEASPTLTLNRPDAFRFDSVGKPLPSVELRLADDGEILARGPNVFSGYHKDDEATQAAFTDDGWLKTGDIGKFTEDGFLQIIDRKKDILVTSGGKNIPPGNIELMFQDDPLIRFVIVYGDGKSYLVLGVWIDEVAMVAHLMETGVADCLEARIMTVQASVDRVNADLARHETIKKFVIIQSPLTVESGLLTPTLKIKRKQIYDAFRAEFEGCYVG